MANIKVLYEVCESLENEMKRANNEIRGKDKLSSVELDFLDKVSHALKSIKTVIAMEEAEERGYSHDAMSYVHGNDRVYHDDSYGRGRYAKRDAMGRYSTDNYGGYSRDDAKSDMMKELHELMHEAHDERTKNEFRTFINKLETM